jgi:putative transposase
VADARAWVVRFVAWYNHDHRHSGIGYVAPADRHAGLDVAILAARKAVYARARDRRPERWAGTTRAWDRPLKVTLNPENRTTSAA